MRTVFVGLGMGGFIWKIVTKYYKVLWQ
jgi:hypothetical protein